MGLIIAVDVGGTFTDLVGVDTETGELFSSKTSTTPDKVANGVMECIKKSGVAVSKIDLIVHGSTVAINTAIEGKGAKAALLTTKGFRDAYIIGRGNRPDAFNIFFKKPFPLIPRNMIFEIDERTLADGTIKKPVEYAEIDKVAVKIKERSVESVAVCFLNSYVNPSNEEQVLEILEKKIPGCYLCKSSSLIRKYGEYERISTTVMNAYVGPTVAKYIKELIELLHNNGFNGHLMIIQSNGGMMSPDSAVEKPAAMMESGPVGGVIAAAEFGKKLGLSNLITLDIGGTTAKTSLIRNGLPQIVEGYHVGGYARGQYVMFPVVDIVEVGAGGGSIVWLDDFGSLKVGPRSAGASPGPVCYGKGGLEPTITDCNLILGRIGPKDFLGGEMPLQLEKAYETMNSKIAEKLGLTVEQAANAAVKIAVSNASLAIRQITIERGYDPRDFVLCAFGGAGPLHATAVARELHIQKVLIPIYPAHFSALGMILANYRKDFVRTFFHNVVDLDFDELIPVLEAMKNESEIALKQEAVEEIEIQHNFNLDMRYTGQEFVLKVHLDPEDLKQRDRNKLLDKFHLLYRRSYGYSFPEESVEIVNIHLVSIGYKKKKPNLQHRAESQTKEPVEYRNVLLDDSTYQKCPVYSRERLNPDTLIVGPAIIREYASATPLMEGDVCRVLKEGSMLISISDKK